MANTDKVKTTERETDALTSASTSALVFISHDSRDAELAEAFSKLLRSVSAGMLKCFRSTGKPGTATYFCRKVCTAGLLKNVVRGSASSEFIVHRVHSLFSRPANKIPVFRLKSDLQRFTQNKFHIKGCTNNECHILFGSRCLGAVHPFNCVQGRL